jgi:hypothetical protein
VRRLSVDQIRARRDSRIIRASRQDVHGWSQADRNWDSATRLDRVLLQRLAQSNADERAVA